MAQLMNDEQRLKTLEVYNPSEHLIEVARDKKNNPVMYYPANWRLYEVSLRYPNANFDSEILHMDVEKNFVIIRARLWMGKSYEESEKKALAMKQGKLSELDKVEKKAKARAASDLGVGTEYALDFDDVDVNSLEREESQRDTEQRQQSAPRQQSAKTAPMITPAQVIAIETGCKMLNREVPSDIKQLSLQKAKEYLVTLRQDYDALQAQQTVASGQPEVQNAVPTQNDSQPSQTQSKPSEIDAVRSRWFKAYHIKDDDQIDIRWKAFKVSLFNGVIEDVDLKQAHLARLNGTVEAHERKQQRTY